KIFPGLHQQYFYSSVETLTINAGDKLIAYVYLDPVNTPSEIMLQWNDGSWEHRAYWGANNIALGTDGTESRRYMGALPTTGQWVRLEVPASQVGLEGRSLQGLSFCLFGGRATWDHAGKSAQPTPTPTPTPTATPTPTPTPAQTVNLKDFGAAGDGVKDDGPALQKALDALAQAGGGTLVVPQGRYALVTPVSKDFTGRASSVMIQGVESSAPVDPTGTPIQLSAGLNLPSEFYPRTGATVIALNISGLRSFLIKDVAFVGTVGVDNDALITLALSNVEDAVVRHCEFYGLRTQLLNGAIVLAFKSGLKIDRTKFLGSTGNSGVYVPVVENLQWKNISITDSIFLDYGQRPELYSKMEAAPSAWVNIGHPETATPDSPRREAVIDNVFLDEGGLNGILSIPTRYQPTPAPIDLIYISRLRMNVSNLGASGNYLANQRAVFIEDALYGWSHNAGSAISLIDVGNAIIDRAECIEDANRIHANAGTGSLFVINSIYKTLDSLAQTTKVITTEAAEDDPVQYVRGQYETLLGREPDPAGHYYWSNLLLQCGDNTQCLANARASFNSYLGKSPSPNFSIAGVVRDENNLPLPGVVITLGGSQAVTLQTDAGGRYSFKGLPTSGVYTITAAKTGYTFPLPSRTVTTPAGDESVDFTAALPRHTVRGRLTNSAGNPVAGATVMLSGAQNSVATTDASGNYSFPNLPEGGTYTLTPSKSTYVFSPQSQTIQNLGGDSTADFTLRTQLVSGRVTTVDGSGVEGVTLTLSGSATGQATTDSSGNYVLANLPAGGSYTVTPSKAQNTFGPSNRTFNSLSADLTANFTATLNQYTVGGRVTLNGVGFSGVTVALSGSKTGMTTTDAGGNYSFANLPAGGNYTVTLSKINYTFAPPSVSFNNLSGNQVGDFTAELSPGVPVLINEPNSTRAIALDAVLRLDEPFQLNYSFPWGADNRTRIILYAENFELQPGESAAAVTADVEDASHRIYPLAVEHVGKVEGVSRLNRIIVRLHDDLGDVGDVLVRITYRGAASNRLRIGIGHVGGGPPVDADSAPTPSQPPN
ncbi:MAG TPA: carboxypeptidase regulatory-like domain-containing protein, partial [Pyrinomonadaceae bacterium]|nr:carboxypeptidase regulatory-like domain-containing protein [Pyrinomonadaceae bacterium]